MKTKITNMLKKKDGFFNPQILTQFPIMIMFTNLIIYFGIFGADFYNNASGYLFK